MKPRPKYLNLPAIRLPLPGILSIFHRISGVILMMALPFALWALDLSVASEESYAQIAKCLSHPFIKLCVWGAAWALFHHLCAGIRFLLLDFHVGMELAAARFSAAAAFAVSILMTIIFGVWLW
ncbi:MAG: succinate dehydrogenase, cytochrome b556 subunit [Betaproteobacteria bacterium]|nr:succinate dehydrogenase, cytochrome b556 subunit [Betaproteobacteria bacterium]